MLFNPFYNARALHISRPKRVQQNGFTLIEVIIGIVVLSISMGIITSLIIPAEERSADQIHQIKAAELGQGMLDEILGRAFDHNSDHVGSVWRCNETGQLACSAVLGPEDGQDGRFDADEDNRTLFNDVDDFHGFSSLNTATDNDLHSGYNNFVIEVEVTYSGTDLGLDNTLAKKVLVTVTTPLGTAIEFAGYKSNF